MRKLSPSAATLASAVAGLPEDMPDEYFKVLAKCVELLQRCRRLSLESELSAIIEARGATERQMQITTSYYGFDGNGGKTLADVGVDFGVTRERIRQIVAQIMKRLPKRSYLPTLDRALRLIPKHLPASELFLMDRLQASNITPMAFKMSGVINAAACFERNIDIEDLGGGLFGTQEQKDIARALISEARAASAHDGAASVSRIWQASNRRWKVRVSRRLRPLLFYRQIET